MKLRGKAQPFASTSGVAADCGSVAGSQSLEEEVALEKSCRHNMVSGDQMAEKKNGERESLYCPACAAEVPDPLVCGDCGAVICRKCGTPLEKIDELGIG
jgi:hypothetical protein